MSTDQSERILTDVFCGGFSSFESKAMGCNGEMKGSRVVVVVFAAVWYTVSGRTPLLFVCWLFISTEVQSTGQIVPQTQSERILTDVYCGGFSSFESKTMGCDRAMKGSRVVVVVFAAVWYIVYGRTPSWFVC